MTDQQLSNVYIEREKDREKYQKKNSGCNYFFILYDNKGGLIYPTKNYKTEHTMMKKLAEHLQQNCVVYLFYKDSCYSEFSIKYNF